MADGSRLGVTDARIEQGHVVATTRFRARIRLALGELVQIHARTTHDRLSLGAPGDGRAVRRLSRARRGRTAATSTWTATRSGWRGRATTAASARRAGRCWPTGSPPATAGSRPWSASTTRPGRSGAWSSGSWSMARSGSSRRRCRSATPPKPIDIDLSGAKVLILVTEFGERGEVRDFADWVEARIIR